MDEKESKKQLRIYAGQLVDRMGVKVDMSKIKDSELTYFIVALKSAWKGI